MSKNSKIEWTSHTFNPWWGCTRVSEGCTHCYAETFARRFGVQWGPQAKRRIASDKQWREPLRWNRDAREAGERRRVFCASMSDVFEDRAELIVPRNCLFELIYLTPDLDWLLLTKRPENVIAMLPGVWIDDGIPNNVWIGATVENQREADRRIPELIKIPCRVKFLSCEPLLERVDLQLRGRNFGIGNEYVNWVICGGESGHGARIMQPDWARSLRDQCVESGIPFFFKQWGGLRKHENGRRLDGRTWDEVPNVKVIG